MKITPRLKPAQLIAIAIILALPYTSTTAITELDTINVTATRTAQTVDETLAAVTVITRDDIDKLQDHDLTELLDGLSGLTITNTGGLGKAASIRLRGTGSGHTLVIIDGVRIGSATLGTTALEHLPLQNIDRIEVVRGPLSHLYGADAVGGVIQIFTRKGRQGAQIDAEVGYGSRDTTDSSLGISGAHGGTDYSLRVSQLKSDGFSARKDNNPDKDGYRNQSIAAQIGHRFNNGLKLGVNILHADGNTEYDSAWTPASDYSSDFVQQSVSGQLEYAPAEWWDISLSAGETKDEITNITDGTAVSFFDTERRQVSWQNDFFIDDESILTLGMDFLHETVDVSSTYTEDKRHNSGYFIQYQSSFGANNFTLALRHDDSDAYENRNTGNIAWGYDFSKSLRLSASYGTAFKAPTFNDLYYSDTWGSHGHTDTRPEKSKSVELALKGQQGWGHWSLNIFRTSIIDLISWVPIAPGSWVSHPQNISKARIKGFEASISTALAGWDITGNLTLLDPRDTTTNKILVQRHKRTLRIDIDQSFGKTAVGATLQARSYNYDDTANNQRISGFGTLDLRASHKVSTNWRIRTKISNLFNKDYETIRGYNTDDRAVFVAVSYQSK
ncbi:Outer membrane vitamin B12 receptor BtuB [hydrothermal vent metagenome]|uniref:Outer membrane vitamin B12 receptor BtuB n=1 Tax=hydrothermal vent metagenome TaxID=652676 RepID=A0A3B1B3G8_9ZZZZ